MKLSSPEKFRPTSSVMDINWPGKGRTLLQIGQDTEIAARMFLDY